MSTCEICDNVLQYLITYRDTMIPMYEKFTDEINENISIVNYDSFDYNNYGKYIEITNKYKKKHEYLEFLKIFRKLLISLKSDRYNMFSEILLNFSIEHLFPSYEYIMTYIKDKIPFYFFISFIKNIDFTRYNIDETIREIKIIKIDENGTKHYS